MNEPKKKTHGFSMKLKYIQGKKAIHTHTHEIRAEHRNQNMFTNHEWDYG